MVHFQEFGTSDILFTMNSDRYIPDVGEKVLVDNTWYIVDERIWDYITTQNDGAIPMVTVILKKRWKSYDEI